MSEQRVGFVAFWKSTDSWYESSSEDRKVFNEKIEKIFEKAEANGIERHGFYDCSWSTEWRYFTFWTAPNTQVIEEACIELEAMGDVNFYNSQYHIVGRQTEINVD